MKIIYLVQHQIHNLTPLYRELSKKKRIFIQSIILAKIYQTIYFVKNLVKLLILEQTVAQDIIILF